MYSARCWGQKESTACEATIMAGVLHLLKGQGITLFERSWLFSHQKKRNPMTAGLAGLPVSY